MKYALPLMGILALFALFDVFLFLPSKQTTVLFPILLAAQTVFIVPPCRYLKSIWAKRLAFLMLIMVVGYLAWSQSRAAWLGLMAGTVLLAHIKRTLNKRIFRKIFVFGLVASIALTFCFKANSSSGRMLIYKVILAHVKPHDLVSGIGAGKFKAQYNLWQANHFTTHNINSPEALLADNTYYAFNDYMQFFIEYGLAGFLVMALLCIVFCYMLQRFRKSKAQHPFMAGALASVAVIAVAALFSYPLQNGWVQVHVLICILFVVLHIIPHKWLKGLVCCVFILAVVFIAQNQFRKWYDNWLGEQAVLLSRTGHNLKALQLLNNAAKNGCADGNVLFLLAKAYYHSGKTDSALLWLQRASGKITNLEITTLFANIYEGTKQYTLAEYYYLTAVYMVPNRFASRYRLIQFYKLQKQNQQAANWIGLTLNLPVKIPSEKVDRILEQLNQ
jgi:tetratricopeptide (TPR) repeat protein